MTRQEAAIAASRGQRREELQPLRLAIANEVERVGWRAARPVIAEVLALDYGAVAGVHGGWWGRIGKRAGPVLLARLQALPTKGQAPPSQGRLF
jgi:hypothetical protein